MHKQLSKFFLKNRSIKTRDLQYFSSSSFTISSFKFILAFLFFLGQNNLLMAQSNKNKELKSQFIENLLSKLSLEEKVGQLNLPVSGDIVSGIKLNTAIADKIKEGKVGGLFNIKGVKQIRALQKIAVENSPHHIPLIIGMDVIHGYETGFPIPLGLSATWDLNLIKQSAQIAATEASADGINWVFSPMVDISRDPRWGRVAEGSGEDCYLGSQIAAAMVEGYQGDLSKANQIMSCVKHFALYGASEAGRDYNTVDMSREKMYNEYLPPYKAALDAGSGSIMASFNDIDGQPATGNKWLLTDLLRNEWGFTGLVVSDYTGIPEMVNHGVGDIEQCAALALNAGVDMDMVGEVYLNHYSSLLAKGKISPEQIDKACRRVLEMKYDLGLFTDPYKYCDTSRTNSSIFTTENRQISRKIAAQSFVLLKNKNQVLPLNPNQKIALIGPLVDNKVNMPGTWSVAVKHDKSISVLAGLKQVLGVDAHLDIALGCNIEESLEAEKRATPFGKVFKRDSRPKEEIWQEALKVAAQADIIVFVGGESAEMTGESSSKTNLNIPEVQKETLRKLKSLGKPIVLVLFTGRPLTLTWEDENLDAILNVWFPGTEAGLAIADVLLGYQNPCGKLSMTFPRNVGQIPIYYNHKNTGRPLSGKWFQKFQSNYLDEVNDPLYPFGYGLSYTQFEYSNLQISAKNLSKKEPIIAKIQIKNVGQYDGYEIVQVYIRDKIRSITPPVKELKGFQKIFLKKGESKIVEFVISEKNLRFYNNQLNFVSEPGEFELMIGTHSNSLIKENFVLTEN